jgi:predicted AAA+ superfamily ATPase
MTFFCVSNIAKPHTCNSLRKVSSNYLKICTDDVIHYLSYLEDVFLLFSVTHYDVSLKPQLNKQKTIVLTME